MDNIFIEAFVVGAITHAGLLLNAVLQNAFVLLHGATGKPVYKITLVFLISGIISSIIGIYGIHHLSDDYKNIQNIIGLVGIIILLYHAYKSYKLSQKSHTHPQSNYGGVLVAISMVWFTPHIYMDMFIISSIAIQYDEIAYNYIILGFSLMAGVWFTSLAIFSRKLHNLFYNDKSHQIMHFLSSVIFLIMAVVLALNIAGYDLHNHEHNETQGQSEIHEQADAYNHDSE